MLVDFGIRHARLLRTAACAALVALPGCAINAKARVPVRPSAQEEAAEQRLLAQPYALATPEDAIVRVVGANMTCTGTLVADDLVLTAHHCLVERGARGEFTKKTIEPSQIRVELGGDYLAWSDVPARAVVAPPCGEAGGAGDVAVIVLSRKVVGLTTMSVRLDSAPRVGEEVFSSGFGRCSLSGDAIRRKERAGGPIRALTSETLHVNASVCPGDSGGPVFAKSTGEIVGIVSLSAMDHDERTSGPSVMARVDTYRLIFAHAQQIADGVSPSELPPLDCGTPHPN